MCNLGDGPPGLLSTTDKKRYGDLYQSRAKGLVGALRSENQADRASIASLLERVNAAQQRPGVSALQGQYTCRIAKLGGLANLVIYRPFTCRIDVLDGTARINKLTGSQRLSGTLVPIGNGFTYAGALHYEREQPVDYGSDPERDQVGCLVWLSADELVLEMPAPNFDSVHDIMILKRISE